VWGQVEEMQAVQSEIAVLKKQGEELQKQCVETTTTLKSINETLKQLSAWVPQVDGSLKSIQATVDSVGALVTALEADRAGAEELRMPAVETDDLENGKSSNALRISVPANNIATRRGFPHTPVNFNLGVQSGNASELEESGYPSSRGGSYRARPPKTEFPKFDGENPKWWKKVCEKYFALYSVDHETWASFATMHFVGNAALWLQTYEAEHDVDGWEELCVAIHNKFGRDKHHKYLEALERCKQTHTVGKYYQKFEALRHQVLVHNRHYDEAYFVTKFVNGLRHDIRRAIRLHSPRTVDAALALAEKQEKLLDEDRPFNHTRSRYEHRLNYNRTRFTGKGMLGHAPEEKNKNTEEPVSQKAKWNEKL
jgi:hypothetical protein